MRFIPTNVHSAVDHVVGPTLIAAPTILGLDRTSPEGIVPRANGIAAALYSNLTDYELSLKNVIPMKLHLALDAMSGAALAAVPFASGARKRGVKHWAPHLALGAFEIGMALLTKTQPPKAKPRRFARVLKLAR